MQTASLQLYLYYVLYVFNVRYFHLTDHKISSLLTIVLNVQTTLKILISTGPVAKEVFRRFANLFSFYYQKP